MSAPKGHKRYGGRVKGQPNKLTIQQRERIEYVLGILDETIEVDLNQIGAVERVKLWGNLQEFIRPKLARTTIDGGLDLRTVSDTTHYSLKTKK